MSAVSERTTRAGNHVSERERAAGTATQPISTFDAFSSFASLFTASDLLSDVYLAHVRPH